MLPWMEYKTAVYWQDGSEQSRYKPISADIPLRGSDRYKASAKSLWLTPLATRKGKVCYSIG